MCGIAGILGADEAPEQAVRSMIERLQHRGPNGIRVESGPGWAVAHARLSIIDLEGGWQPLHAAGSTVIGIAARSASAHASALPNSGGNRPSSASAV